MSGAASGALLAAALLLAGCQTQTTQISEHLPPPPAAELGPQFEVLQAPRYGYDVEGLTDGEGRVHLIVALKGKAPVKADGLATSAEREAMRHDSVMEVRHVIIGPHGVLSSEIIRDVRETPISLDLAYDRQGNLHALIGSEHLIFKDGAWTGGQRTPWREARLTPRSAHFAKGTPDLTWVFPVYGSTIGIPAVSDWTVATSGGGLAPYRRTEDILRRVIVPEETPYRHWYVLNMDRDDVSYVTLLAADRQNAIHVLYATSLISAIWDLRYAAIRPDGACPESYPQAWYRQRKLALMLPDGTPVCPVVGSPFAANEPALAQMQDIGPQIRVPGVTAHRVVTEIDNMDFAMDTQSGAVLMASLDGKSMLAGDAREGADWTDMPIKNAGILLAHAGKGRFHALATEVDDLKGMLSVYYLEYSDRGWSAPVPVGKYANHFFLGHQSPPSQPRQDAFKIITDNNGRALLIWPTEDALVARWVTLK